MLTACRYFRPYRPRKSGSHSCQEPGLRTCPEGIHRCCREPGSLPECLPDSVIKELREAFSFESWQKMDESHTAVRFCTSWATTDEAVDSLLDAVDKLL